MLNFGAFEDKFRKCVSYATNLRQPIGRFYHIILNTKTIRLKSSFLEKSYLYDVLIDAFDVNVLTILGLIKRFVALDSVFYSH